MQAGTLNEIITIQRQTYSQSGSGHMKTDDWQDYLTTRANVKYENGGRIDENNELFFGCQILFGVRIYHDVRPLDRIKFDNRYYRILNIEKQKEIQRKLIRTELIND